MQPGAKYRALHTLWTGMKPGIPMRRLMMLSLADMCTLVSQHPAWADGPFGIDHRIPCATILTLVGGSLALGDQD